MRNSIFGNNYSVAIPRLDKTLDFNCSAVFIGVELGEYSRFLASEVKCENFVQCLCWLREYCFRITRATLCIDMPVKFSAVAG